MPTLPDPGGGGYRPDGDGRSLRRRFVALTFLRWFPTGLLLPVFVLLLTARGLPVPVVGVLFAAYGVTVALLELPTGGLADVIGRRTVLAAAAVLTLAGTATLAVGTAPALLAAAVIVTAVGRALDSGPLEAWYVDAAATADPHVDLKPALAAAGAATALGLGVGAVAASGLVAAVPLPARGDAVLLDLSVPYLAAAALGLGHLAAILAWVDEPARSVRSAPSAGGSGPGGARRRPLGAGRLARAGRVVRAVPGAVGRGLRLVRGNSVLRRLSARAALLGVAISAAEVLGPVLFGRTVGAEGYGLLVTAAFAGTAAGARLAPLLARLLRGTGRALTAATLLAAAGVGCLALPGFWPAAAAYLLFYTALGLDDPLAGALLHAEAAAGERATVLSVQSLVFQGGGTLGALTLPALAQATALAVAWLTAAGLLVGATIVVAGIRRGGRSAGRGGLA